ncbi:MAG TPA: hypothetical protein VKN99_28130 [Polyangia bacterium]|nr:hypothetical protein [Polyangia bacterium]
MNWLRKLALVGLILVAPASALASPLHDLCDRADASFDEPAEAAAPPALAPDPRCDLDNIPLSAALDCSDDSNPIFLAAVGTCDLAGAAAQVALAPVPAGPPGPAPTRDPPSCSGASCLPLHAPLASDTPFWSGGQPLVGAATPAPTLLGASALPEEPAGAPRAGHHRRIDRPPRA